MTTPETNYMRASSEPSVGCMRRYRNGTQTLTNNAVMPIQLNADDTSVARGTGLPPGSGSRLSASGNGIAVGPGALCLVLFKVFFSGVARGVIARGLATHRGPPPAVAGPDVLRRAGRLRRRRRLLRCGRRRPGRQRRASRRWRHDLHDGRRDDHR